MTTITKSGSKLTVGAMNHETKNIAKKIFDLKDHKGERVRVHIGTDGKYTIGTNSRQKLLVCEIDIPERKYVHTEKVVNGETVVESSEKELKLGEITMIEHLKEVE
jgi:uncharacterized protein (UPF0333 family)